MSREKTIDSDLLGRLPRHRARGRSPHREGTPLFRGGENQPPNPGTVPPNQADWDAAATAQDAVRMAAEVADIALTAAALLMREMLVHLQDRDGPRSTPSDDPR